jgi:hypothetical protein
MRIRKDTAFVSSVLFTIALLGLVPPFFKVAFLGHDKAAFQRLDWSLQLYSRLLDQFGLAALAILVVGLIVTWAGYVKKVRWTWFVMFVIVWGWFVPVLLFPDVLVPLYRGAVTTSLSGLILAALGGESGLARGFLHEIVTFVLMVIALALPMKAFFGRGKAVASAIPNCR